MLYHLLKEDKSEPTALSFYRRTRITWMEDARTYELIKICKRAGKLESERITAEISRTHKEEKELGEFDNLRESE